MKKDKNNFKAQIQKVLLGNIIMTRYNNKTYKVDDIAFNRNPKETFDVSCFINPLNNVLKKLQNFSMTWILRRKIYVRSKLANLKAVSELSYSQELISRKI